MDYSNKVEEFMSVINDYNKLKEKSDVSIPDKGIYAVMGRLFINKEMYSCQLAKELNISRARLSLIVKKLKAKKYVTSRCPLTDRRKMLIKITEEGIRVVKEKYISAKEKLKKLFEKLGEEKSNLMISLMKDIIEVYENDKEGELVKC